MARVTFANIRIVNKLLKGEFGPKTIHIPTGEKLSVFEVAMRYKSQGHDTIILAGEEYGSGSSRDWAAKGPMLQAKGGSLAFLATDPSLRESSATSEASQNLLLFMNGEHEYIIFNPHKKQDIISKNPRKNQAAQDEAERLGYTSIYGDLSNSNAKHNHLQEVPFVPSERPWETIFSASSHVLPPLTKLCASFFESLLEKRPENSNEMMIAMHVICLRS